MIEHLKEQLNRTKPDSGLNYQIEAIHSNASANEFDQKSFQSSILLFVFKVSKSHLSKQKNYRKNGVFI